MSLSPSRRITIPLIASRTRHSSARDTSCGQFTGKNECRDGKKKKKEGEREKKIGVRQSMGGRVKRPVTIPFPHAINRTIAANAVNLSSRMFQLWRSRIEIWTSVFTRVLETDPHFYVPVFSTIRYIFLNHFMILISITSSISKTKLSIIMKFSERN